MLSVYDYIVELSPSEACAGLDWEIRLNGRAVARFASEEAAMRTARLLSAVDREAGRNPTIHIGDRIEPANDARDFSNVG
jgi:hypothetical protein